MNDRKDIQEAEYEFPYHYIPKIEERSGRFTQIIDLYWGYEYLSYIKFIIELLRKEEFKTLIDLGCGDGRLLSEIHKQFPDKELLGTDFSARAIQFARLFNPQTSYEVEDIHDTDIQRSYDIACSIEVIEHIPNEKVTGFVLSLVKKVKKGGILIISTPTDNIPVPKKHYQHFNINKLNSLFTCEFELKKVYYINSNSSLSSIIQRLFGNRFFAVKGVLSNFLYSFYTRHLFHSKEGKSKRILCIYQKL